MDSRSDTPHAAINLTHGCVVATIQIELEERQIAQLQQDILNRIQQTRAHGLILDVSGLTLIDAVEFRALQRIAKMAQLMGARSTLVGLRPGIVAALVQTDLDFSLIQAAQSLEDAFLKLNASRGPLETTSNE